MKVLNLYAGIGGNRKLWIDDVKVTSVEYQPEIARIYKDHFPQDEMIIGDAHSYLLEHFREFDFIWSSPPCQSHSRLRFGRAKAGQYKAKFPDLKLWQEIIFLKYYCEVPWLVENVIPFYANDLFLPPSARLGRHLFWSNFRIHSIDTDRQEPIEYVGYKDERFGFNLTNYKIAADRNDARKDQILRNLVDPEIGLHLLNQARGIITEKPTTQIKLF